MSKLKSIYRKLGFITVSVALLSQTLLISGMLHVNAQQKKRGINKQEDQPVATQEDSVQIKSNPIQVVSKTLVDVRSLASASATASSKTTGKGAKQVAPATVLQTMPAPGTITEVATPSAPSSNNLLMNQVDVPQPLVPSPTPSQNFQGAIDEAIGGGPSGTFTIPPDTMGAVGINKVMSFVNNNLVIQDKTTGSVLTLVGVTSFFSSTGASGVFDPRVLYDAYNNRWIVAAVSNAQTANSSVIVGVSQTSDPNGNFILFRFIVGCAPGSPGCNAAGGFADFPMLGFNKNWLVVT